MSKENIKKYIGGCCRNSFIIFDCRNEDLSKKQKSELAKRFVNLYKVDSALFLLKTKGADVAFKIFEKDGSESDSCGNGTLLIAFLLKLKKGKIKIGENVFIVSSDSKKISIAMNKKRSIIKKAEDGKFGVFVKFGEPHLVSVVSDLKKVNLIIFGREAQFKYPKGINVDILEKLSNSRYLIKTYERGVFDVTKSCGTGSLSSYSALRFLNALTENESVEFKSGGGIHIVSEDKKMLKLETLKKFCKIKNLN